MANRMTMLEQLSARITLVTLITIALLPGCAGQQDNLQDTKALKTELMLASVASWVGQPRAELEQMLGEPTGSIVEGKKTRSVYYFVDEDFARPNDMESFDPADPTSYQCKFTVTYVRDIVTDTKSEGVDCILTP